MHAIPANGQIKIEFPKWNNFDGVSASQYEPYVATSTSPGSVPCEAVSGIPMINSAISSALTCVFEHDTSAGIDTLSVQLEGLLSGDVPAGMLSF